MYALDDSLPRLYSASNNLLHYRINNLLHCRVNNLLHCRVNNLLHCRVNNLLHCSVNNLLHCRVKVKSQLGRPVFLQHCTTGLHLKFQKRYSNPFTVSIGRILHIEIRFFTLYFSVC